MKKTRVASKQELVKHAAVKSKSGMIILGKCHADCFYLGTNIGLKMSSKPEDQGFFTNKGRYVDRKKAASIAKKANQLDTTDKRKVIYLLSEDIWYQRERFYYDYIKGYMEILR